MLHAVAQTAPSRKPRRNPLDYTRRELALMMVASCALLGNRAPRLSIADLAEAERLLEELDAAPADHPTPGDEDPQDDAAEHEDDCTCWLHDDEPAYHADDACDVHRDLAADRRVLS